MKAVAAAVALMAWEEAGALVTAPVSKEALRLGGYPWPGQTEMLADLVRRRRPARPAHGGTAARGPRDGAPLAARRDRRA